MKMNNTITKSSAPETAVERFHRLPLAGSELAKLGFLHITGLTALVNSGGDNKEAGSIGYHHLEIQAPRDFLGVWMFLNRKCFVVTVQGEIWVMVCSTSTKVVERRPWLSAEIEVEIRRRANFTDKFPDAWLPFVSAGVSGTELAFSGEAIAARYANPRCDEFGSHVPHILGMPLGYFFSK